MYVPVTGRGQKRPSQPLQLELLSAVSCHMSAGHPVPSANDPPSQPLAYKIVYMHKCFSSIKTLPKAKKNKISSL